jgi:hypothetical protein
MLQLSVNATLVLVLPSSSTISGQQQQARGRIVRKALPPRSTPPGCATPHLDVHLFTLSLHPCLPVLSLPSCVVALVQVATLRSAVKFEQQFLIDPLPVALPDIPFALCSCRALS